MVSNVAKSRHLFLFATLTTVQKIRDFNDSRLAGIERLLQPCHGFVDANVRVFTTWPIRVLLLFFIAQVCVRSLLPLPLGYDEGEQLIVTQQFAWGYCSQPPLYNWLQHGFFFVFGVNAFAMILLKQLILMAIFLTTYGLWRKTGLNVALASACTFSLFLLNEVGWELQRTRTHLALAVWMAALFALVAVIIVRQYETCGNARRAMWYAALGVVAGLGILSKYNFVLFPGALTIAALCSRPLRKTVLTPWSLFALLVAGLVVLPHGLWVLEHREWLASQSTEKFGLVGNGDFLQSRRSGANAFGGAVFMFFLQPLFVGTILQLDWRDWNYPSSAVFAELDADSRQLVDVIGIACAIAIGMVFVVVIGTGMTVVRSRWLVPAAFLSLAPLILRTRILRGPNTHRIYWLAVLTILLASSIAITKVAVEFTSARNSNLPVLAGPIWNLAAEQQETSAAIVEDQRLAGLIRLQHPGMRVLVPDYSLPDLHGVEHVVVIAEAKEEGCFDNKFTEFAAAVFPGRAWGNLTQLDEPGLTSDDETPWMIANLNQTDQVTSARLPGRNGAWQRPAHE
jgi:4-amino-4-deoxy-L-arabinose transferase-like glycosyltransferase